MDSGHDRPKVSFIVPAFNPGAKWLRQSIESVLSQTIEAIEVVVIDDGSTDGSVDEVAQQIADRRVQWIRQANQGKSAAMNRGIAEARADVVAVQDADDLSSPGRAEAQLSAFEDPEIGMVFCGHDLVVEARRMAPHVACKDRDECGHLLSEFRMPGHDPTMMARRDLLLKHPYRQGFEPAEGLDLVIRLGEHCCAVNVGGPYYGYRIHPDSLTKSDPLKRERKVREVLREAAERRGGVDPRQEWRSKRPRGDNGLYADFIESAKQLKRAGRRRDAISCGMASIGVAPLDIQYYKAIVHSLLP